MNYLSEMLGIPVIDSTGEKIGVVNDMGIATGEVFPHVTSLAFQGPGKTPFMISWRKYVDHVDDSGVYLPPRTSAFPTSSRTRSCWRATSSTSRLSIRRASRSCA